MTTTAIEWATHVWNPVTGCDRVSPGCANCYALTYAARLKAMGQPKYQRDGGRASGPGFGVTMHEAALDEPARWRKPRRVFVNSMSDLFHEEVDPEFVRLVFDVMSEAPDHQFLVLTKRPERMRQLVQWITACGACEGSGFDMAGRGCGECNLPEDEAYIPPHNVWLGVTIENRRFVHRADLLRQTPAAVRFISAEPLLGPLYANPDGRRWDTERNVGVWEDGYEGPELDLTGIDWVIAGGESGHGHRPIRAEWVRDLRDACTVELCRRARHDLPGRVGPAFFFKQWGGHTPKAGGRELDGRTWDEIPQSPMERIMAEAVA